MVRVFKSTEVEVTTLAKVSGLNTIAATDGTLMFLVSLNLSVTRLNDSKVFKKRNGISYKKSQRYLMKLIRKF